MTGSVLFLSFKTAGEQAAHWFAKRRSGEMSVDAQSAFEAWMAADLSHAVALEELDQLWDDLALIRSDPSILTLREDAVLGLRQIRRRRVVRGLAAACAMLVVVTAGVGWLVRKPRPWAIERAETYRTRIGQTLSVSLRDGSLAVLDTNSILRVWPGRTRERRLQLLQGRAFFKVSKDTSRPFIVQAAGRDVAALGTQFDVYLKPHLLQVTLVEGRLRIRSRAGSDLLSQTHAPTVEMTAGYRLLADAHHWDLAKTDARSEVEWTQGRLVFDEERIGDIAAELNRYSTRRIVISSPAVARNRMSAVLGAMDADTFVAAVQTMKLARVERGPAGGYRLAPP